MSSYKLTYFNGRGRAEITRLIFAAAGVEFEDVRYEFSEWPNKKNETPLGQLPYLTVDGLHLPQSLAIARLIAKRYNLAGNGDLEQAKADAVVDTLNDLQNVYYPKVFLAKGEDKPAAVAKFLAEDAVDHLGKIEKTLNLFGTEGYSVGSSFTWADLFVFDITSLVHGLDQNALNNYPRILSVRNTVQANERVAKYLQQRPSTPF
nr:glutathione S-transferase GSTS12/13-2 [Brachionus angularis]